MEINDQTVAAVAAIAKNAGQRLLDVFSPDARPVDRDELQRVAARNEQVSADGLRDALHELRPDARFIDGDLETTALPDSGEWWAIDNAEGSVNHVHGLAEWGVSIALIVDRRVELAVFRQPIGDLTYTARRGFGSWLNGSRLTVAQKNDLDIAIVGTGQAEARQVATYAHIGRSIETMLEHAFLVRATVPSTFPMLLIAAGNMDAFWQYEPVLPGVAAGSLLISEAGGLVTTIDGGPWAPGASTIAVGSPAVHAALISVLAVGA
ncbi:3'(2'),5'-bisphosphate nucleotidase CysQ [Glaciihabitans arcticus]|uniref:3'(2'),5'-bisphosphate nucleotidase CysQ n=1 Tax=Glaciihabitans arcticus TaxID=2668039 RepID=A0A4Q9GTV1_9MICO|nr:inositol monophosphatase family protein [Glaciihabitans arcticus]TBN57614.1 3'(2'),5'-bisphosphate nucleotidase CysQ [Glaciihabitans arcticus]